MPESKRPAIRDMIERFRNQGMDEAEVCAVLAERLAEDDDEAKAFHQALLAETAADRDDPVADHVRRLYDDLREGVYEPDDTLD